MPDMPYSLLPFDDALQYISDNQDMSEPIRYVLDHLDEWQLIWYGSQRKTYVNWNFRPLLTFFCNVTTLFSSVALSPTQFTTFFLDGGSYVFRSLIKSTLLAGKDLWSLVDSEFLFSCSTRRLTRERSELSANSWDIELKIMGSSKSRSSLFSYLNVLSTGAFLLLVRFVSFLFSFLNFFWQDVLELFFCHFPFSFSAIER